MARSARKVVLWLAGGILLLMALAATALWVAVDTAALKQQLETRVRERTGREFAIAAPLELTLFPALGVRTGGVVLGNAPGFGDRPMLEVERLAIEVELLPLLRGEVRVDTVVLDGLRLRLLRNRRGRGNWEGMPITPAPATGAPRAPTDASTPAASSALPLLSVAGIRVRDARIDWEDAATGSGYHLGPLDLVVGRIVPGQPFPVSARLAVASHEPAIRGTVALKSRVTYEPQGPILRVAALAITPDLNGKALPGGRVAGELASPELRIDLAADRLDSPRLQWRENGLRIALNDVAVTALRTAPAWRATLSVPAFDLRGYLARLNVALPPMADTTTLRSLALDARLAGNTRQLAATALRLKLDESTLRGEVRLPRLAPPALRFDLRLDAIDADRYLPAPAKPPKTPRDVATPATAGAAAVTNKELPLELLRKLDLAGRIRIDRLKAMNLRSRAIQIPLQARDGRIRLAPLAARLYQGTYAGDIRLDATGAIPRLQLDERLENVQIGPLLKDLLGKDKLRGTANLAATLAANGLDPAAFRRTLDGTVRFDFRDGAMAGFDLPRIEQELRARLKGQPVPPPTAAAETAFSRITGSARIRNGLARNDDLRAALPHARAIGKGRLDLVRETVDYTLWVKFTSEVAGQAGTPYEKLDKPALPIHFTGPLAAPAIRPDFEAVLKALARRELKKREQEVKERARKALEKKARELFKGLKLP